MSLAGYLKALKIDDIEDDQEFMDAEYNAIHAFCKICGYSLRDADLETVKYRGMEECFISWQELYAEDLQQESGRVL